MPERLNKNGFTEKEFLQRYNGNKYPSPSNTVDTVIFSITSEEEKIRENLQRKNYRSCLLKEEIIPG